MPRTKDMGIRNILAVLSALRNGEKTPYAVYYETRFKSLATTAQYMAFCLAANLIEPVGEKSKKVFGQTKSIKSFHLTKDGETLLKLSNNILRAIKNR